MKVLSLFDGISCARVALERAGIPVERYFASEIDKYAIEVSKKNWPDIVQMGSVKDLRVGHYNGLRDPNIFIYGNGHDTQANNFDLLIGGSPCQDLSIAKKDRKGLAGERSGLFYEYLRILNEVKPKWFILENVASMSQESRAEITKLLGVEPVMIDAGLVSAQRRKRLFWTNIPGITQLEDRGILLEHIIHETHGESFVLEKYIANGKFLEYITDPEKLRKRYTQINGEKSITMTARQYANWNGQFVKKNVPQSQRVYGVDGKSVTLQANGGGAGAKTGLYIIQTPRGRNKGGLRAINGKTPVLTSGSWSYNNKLLIVDKYIRRLTPVECERLQSLPDGYTSGISDNRAYKCIGNAFNVDVIAHILKHIPLNN